MASKILRYAAAWLVTLLVPLTLVFLGVRLLLTPGFLAVEYRLPGFPADTYGFTLDDRLEYAPRALEYLVSDLGIDFLAGQTFPDGTSLYNRRELDHMLDVKNVLVPGLRIGLAATLVLFGTLIFSWRKPFWPDFLLAVRRGGWVMVGTVAAIALVALVSFWDFFTAFHTLFFEGDSWLFYYSDTLIRLFPMRFWQDVFITIGAFCLLAGLAIALGLKPSKG